ncbi:MAG: hypothetical protein KDE27_06510 [Planctomycetes bacterium]|nr:hypothetical protein [Planctomycetota bacterium]
MTTRFELVADDRGRISYCLVDNTGNVLLQGLPCRGKIDAQTEVLHTRKALDSEHLVPHQDGEGMHFVVLKDDEGNVLGRSPHVASSHELGAMVNEICAAGPRAAMIDQTRR